MESCDAEASVLALWIAGMRLAPRCFLSPGYALCLLAEILDRLLDIFMSPQSYMQGLAPCNASLMSIYQKLG